MARALDYFEESKSIEYYLNLDGDPGSMDQVSYANYKQAQAIKEQKKLAEQREADERAARIKAAKERIPYSDKLAEEICERLSSGELLTVICNDPRMPTARSVTRWLKAHNDFAALYNMALQGRLTIFEEQVIQFADDKSRDVQRATPSSSKEKVQFVDPVQRAKLQIEVRMRHLKAGKPQKWGEVSTLITKSDDPFDCDNLSSEEIERRIAEIERKEAIVRETRVPQVSDLFER